MAENGTYVAKGGGRGAALRERKRIARQLDGAPETPQQRRDRLRRIAGKEKR